MKEGMAMGINGGKGGKVVVEYSYFMSRRKSECSVVFKTSSCSGEVTTLV